MDNKELLKQMIADGVLIPEVAAKYCPELKEESEDERIRAKLIEFFTGYTTDEEWWGSVTEKDILAWLEKQGRWQYPTTYNQVETATTTMEGLQKQGEQKPAEDVDLPELESHLCLMFQKFRTKGICTNGEIIDYVKEHSQKLKDILVKPAWSEEDKRIIDNLISQLGNLFARKLIKEETKDKYVNWLKSLRPQKLSNVERNGKNWKPSDEQMKALANALSLAKSCGEESAFDLRTLYEQLKKLREE